MTEGKIGPTTYLATLVALLALAGLSFFLSYLELGVFETPVALFIAAIKATLVVLFFMHLAEQTVQNRAVMAVAAAFVVLLVTFIGLDIATRFRPPNLPPAW